MKVRVILATLCLLIVLGASAQAKGGAVARLHAPVPTDLQPGATITIAWSLVFPDDNDQPFNACRVFVQLRSAAGAAPMRAYADGGACRAHPTGTYEATVIVPDGGISAVEVGLSGTTDIYFPVVPPAAPSPAAPAAPPSELAPNLAVIGAAIGLAGAAVLIAMRRRVLAAAG